jgi:hypothetical protein
MHGLQLLCVYLSSGWVVCGAVVGERIRHVRPTRAGWWVGGLRFHFNSGRLAQQGTFKGVWLNKERTEWALEKLLQGEK